MLDALARDGSGHSSRAGTGQNSIAAPTEHEDGHHSLADIGQRSDAILVPLMRLHSQRTDYHNAEKRLVLQIKAICRRMCDGDKVAGTEMFKVEKKAPSPRLAPMYQALALVERARKDVEKALTATVAELPVATWVNDVPGLNLLSLGQLVAELAPLLDHGTSAETGQWDRVGQRSPRLESLCWKRMGLGLVDGEIQRKATDKIKAERMGYNPQRRALTFVISGNLIMNVHRNEGPYYTMYLREKRKQLERGLTKGHADRRAKRYIVKKLIRHFLAVWCRMAIAGGSPQHYGRFEIVDA